MSNETTTKSRASRSSAKKTAETFDKKVQDIAPETMTDNASVVEEKKVRIVPREVDLNQLIVVRNGFQGRLTYTNPRSGETFVWPEFGDEQMIELRELRNAKNTYKKFFISNWFMFDEDNAWVIDYLGVAQYYKNALTVDGFDDLFSKSAAEIEATIALLSAGQKKSVAYRAKQLIADGSIDSNRAIAALERSLGIELVERY